MLSEKTITTVKATAPVLAEHGLSITRAFYKRMFQRHPELKNMFNMTNQKRGTQPKALAHAVLQYAKHIDQLEVLAGAVETIAQKHSSLAVTADMYPIVGENLLAAIQEVLDLEPSSEVIRAWGEAYGALADILINREEAIYQEGEHRSGGFRGKKAFVVWKKEKETTGVTSFYFKCEDGSPVPTFLPGQYLAISVQIPNCPHLHTRNYSLSDVSGQDYLRISVKRETGPVAAVVSNYLHDSVTEGTVLELGMPCGEFVLEETSKPIVLLAGGIGITPLFSMFKTLATQDNAKAILVHCTQNSSNHVFKEVVETLVQQSSAAELQSLVVYENPLPTDTYDGRGYLNETLIQTIPNYTNSIFYCCGPKAFMGHCISMLTALGIPETQIHYEFFGPVETLEMQAPDTLI